MQIYTPEEEMDKPSQSMLIGYDDSIIGYNTKERGYNSFEVVDNKIASYKNHSKQNYTLGITFAVISSVGYSSNVVFGKMALERNPILTTYDINFIRA